MASIDCYADDGARHNGVPETTEDTQKLAASAAQVSVCFVPEQECVSKIVGAIAAAKTSIRLQAYSFTSVAILEALAKSRSSGVDVAAILDKSDDRGDDEKHKGRRNHLTGARFTAEANIPTWIDDRVSIAHNKVIIIDGHLVIGGSYNYSSQAERRNAENVTFIDSPEVAALYLKNWQFRKALSRPSSYQDAER